MISLVGYDLRGYGLASTHVLNAEGKFTGTFYFARAVHWYALRPMLRVSSKINERKLTLGIYCTVTLNLHCANINTKSDCLKLVILIMIPFFFFVKFLFEN